MREGLFSERKAGLVTERAVLRSHFFHQLFVVTGIGNDSNKWIILCRCAHHGRATDIDIFDGVFKRNIRLGDGGGEGIKIYDNHVDGWDIVLLHRIHVMREIATREDATVHARMQRLHAAIHHLRKPGVVTDFHYLDAVLGK